MLAARFFVDFSARSASFAEFSSMCWVNRIQRVAIAAIFATSAECFAAEPQTGWSVVPEIIARIKAPRFANQDFFVTNFGASPDNKTDCKPALDKAIAVCSKAGGGRVIVPAGHWLVAGPIHLKSNVNLQLEKGATIRFSPNPAHSLPLVHTRFEGNEVFNYSPLVYAYDQENIAITGAGTLDGQAGKKA